MWGAANGPEESAGAAPCTAGGEGALTISVVGQLVGAVVFFLLGFVPGYVTSWILKQCGLLRVGEAAEINGLDPTKVPNIAYPEGITPSMKPAE